MSWNDLYGQAYKQTFHQKFWVVWAPAQGEPTTTHKSHQEALDEAQRLSKKHPKTTFYVLVAEKEVEYIPPPPSGLQVKSL